MERFAACISKYNSNYEKQITLLMIPNEKCWIYIVVKKVFCITKRNNFKTQW